MHPSSYFLGLYFCQWENLGTRSYSGGGHWNDKMSSFVNNQTFDTYTSFHNWNGTNAWIFRFDSYALDIVGNLGTNNNVIDGIQVC